MVRNKLCLDASYVVGLPKKRKVGLNWYEFFVCIINSVPCDRIVQRAHWPLRPIRVTSGIARSARVICFCFNQVLDFKGGEIF